MNSHEQEIREERRLSYVNRTNDMRQMKNQQWIIVYYCSLVFVALISFSTKVHSLRDSGALLLFGIALFVTIFGIWALIINQIHLREHRELTLRLERTFLTKQEFHIRPVKPIYLSYWYHWQYWITFKVAILLGLFLTVWILLRNKRLCLKNALTKYWEFAAAPIIILSIILLVRYFRKRKKEGKKKSYKVLFEEIAFYDP